MPHKPRHVEQFCPISAKKSIKEAADLNAEVALLLLEGWNDIHRDRLLHQGRNGSGERMTEQCVNSPTDDWTRYLPREPRSKGVPHAGSTSGNTIAIAAGNRAVERILHIPIHMCGLARCDQRRER